MLGVLAGLLAIGGGTTLQFVTLSTINFGTFSELDFRLTLTPASALATLGFGVSISMALVAAALHTSDR